MARFLFFAHGFPRIITDYYFYIKEASFNLTAENAERLRKERRDLKSCQLSVISFQFFNALNQV